MGGEEDEGNSCHAPQYTCTRHADVTTVVALQSVKVLGNDNGTMVNTTPTALKNEVAGVSRQFSGEQRATKGKHKLVGVHD